jgi:hypothetical protein
VTSSQPRRRNHGFGVEVLSLATSTDSRIADQNRSAARVVAALAVDLDDCIELLAMLGLTATTNQIGPVEAKAKYAREDQPDSGSNSQ